MFLSPTLGTDDDGPQTLGNLHLILDLLLEPTQEFSLDAFDLVTRRDGTGRTRRFRRGRLDDERRQL